MAKKYAGLDTLRFFLDNLKETFSDLGHKHTISDITDYKVDSELSPTSTNPIQNKVLDAEFDAIADAMGLIETAVTNKSDKTHNHDEVYYTKTELDVSLSNKSDAGHTHSFNDLDDKPFGYEESGTSLFFSVDYPAGAHTINAYSGVWDAGYYRIYVNGVKYPDVYVLSPNVSSIGDLEVFPCYFVRRQTGPTSSTWTVSVRDNTIAYDIKVYKVNYSTKQLDEIYIPDTIARTEYVDTQIETKASADHNHDSVYDTKGSADVALASAQTYTDEAVANLLENSTDAVDSIYELRDAMQENAGAIEALTTIAGSKADKEHGHSISNITGLQEELNAKAAQLDLDTLAGVVSGKANSTHNHAISDVTGLQNAFDALESEIDSKLSGKSDITHTHDVITNAEIDAICGASITIAEGGMY